MSSFEFLGNCCRQVCALRKGVREVSSVFSTHLVLGQNSVQETSTTTSPGFYEFHDTGHIEILLYFGAYMNLRPHFPLFCPIWVKISIVCLHVMLLISYELLQNQCRKDCFFFLIGINKKHLSM